MARSVYLGSFYQLSTKCTICDADERIPLEPYCRDCIDKAFGPGYYAPTDEYYAPTDETEDE